MGRGRRARERAAGSARGALGSVACIEDSSAAHAAGNHDWSPPGNIEIHGAVGATGEAAYWGSCALAPRTRES